MSAVVGSCGAYVPTPTRAAADGAKAFVDPDGYRRWIESARATFEGLVAKEQ